MADMLLIHLHPDNPQASWALVNEQGELISRPTHGGLAEAQDIARQHRTLILLDAALVHSSTISLPTQNPQKLLRAAPYALEEELADDIDDMHFVAAKAVKDKPTPVLAVHRKVMDKLLQQCNDAGIKPAAVIADALCLPASSEQWCALFHGDQVVLQTAALQGSKFDRELFNTLLEAELQNHDSKPQKLLLFVAEQDTAPDISLHDIETTVVQYNTHPLVVFAAHTRQAMALNLLQHDYKLQSQSGFAWRRWRLTAALALVWLLLSLGVDAWRLQQLKAQNRQLQAQIVKIYKQAFPQSKRIVNARVQMENKLKALQAGGGIDGSVIELLAQSAPALSATSSVNLKSISFRNNRLDLAVNSKDLASLQQLNTRLNKVDGIRSEIVSSSSEQNQVRASLRIQKAST